MAAEEKDLYNTAERPVDVLSSENDEKTDLTERERFARKAEAENIAPAADVEFMYEKIVAMTIEEALEILEAAVEYHGDDKNFPFSVLDKIKRLVQGYEASGLPPEEFEFECKTEAAVIKYHSAYPEVRAIADPYDDPNELVETVRSWFLALFWAIIGMGVNTFFQPRFPTIQLNSQIVQLLLYPTGKLLEWVLPDWGFTVRGVRHSLNPGPWGYKEQMFATISFNVCLTTVYVYSNFQVQRLPVYFNGKYVTIGYEILLTLSNQCMGFGFAGLLRRFAVYPAKSIWPTILPTVALSRALLVPDHGDSPVHGWRTSRYKFFFIALAAAFLYYWIPGYLFTALSTFNWMTWIAPNNFKLSMVTGSTDGLGFNPINTFDWLVFNQLLPFQSPFFAFFQQFIGTTLAGFVIIAIYMSRRRWTQYIPINTSQIYANDGNPYQVTKVLNDDGTFNREKYKKYSPPYYSAANLVVYGSFFAFYPLTVVYMFVDEWKLARDAFVGLYKDMVFDLSNVGKRFFTVAWYGCTFRFGKAKEAFNAPAPQRPSMFDGYKDAHSVMMMNYPEAPDWWFLCIFLCAFVFGVICVTQYPIHTPIWTLFFVVGLNAAYIVPMTIINSVTGLTEGLNVLTELIIGYALPGNAQALMFAKAYGYNINGQADNYISDQKMAHYAKIPPRAVFRGQLISTIITCFVSIGVMEWQFSNIIGLCTPGQEQNFTCANQSQVYYAAAVTWGSIGPKRMFDYLYPELQWCFLVGFVVAILFLLGQRGGHLVRDWSRKVLPSGVFKTINTVFFKPMSWLKVVNPAVVCNGFLQWAPLNWTYAISSMYVNFAFHYIIKRRYTAWWEKYCYVLAAALTGGTALSALIIFFATGYHPKPLSWWGNNVSNAGIDGSGAALDKVPEGDYFGLRRGTFS